MLLIQYYITFQLFDDANFTDVWHLLTNLQESNDKGFVLVDGNPVIGRSHYRRAPANMKMLHLLKIAIVAYYYKYNTISHIYS